MCNFYIVKSWVYKTVAHKRKVQPARQKWTDSTRLISTELMRFLPSTTLITMEKSIVNKPKLSWMNSSWPTENTLKINISRDFSTRPTPTTMELSPKDSWPSLCMTCRSLMAKSEIGDLCSLPFDPLPHFYSLNNLFHTYCNSWKAKNVPRAHYYILIF